MKKLTAILCLTLAVLLGSERASANTNSQKDAIALENLIQRNGLYYTFLSPTPYTGIVSGRKTGYLKNGKWHGEYVEVSAIKGFILSGSYRNGVRIGEWKFLIEKQNITLSIFAEYENGVLRINEK